MTILVIIALVFAFCLLLLAGLLTVIRNLAELDCQGGPIFSEQSPIFHDQETDQQARSQFAWQSRSHFRAPD
jgi:hypothetical protein